MLRTIKTINKNKIKYLEKNKINMDSYKKDHKDFIRNNKLILKTQQRFKSECIMFLLKRLIRLFLSSNDDKRMQSIDSIETYAYATSKNLISDKEEIKCSNIIKQYKR